jgi:hypothetical protein
MFVEQRINGVRNMDWWEIGGNSLFLLLGLLWVVGLFFPGLGRHVYGDTWPGNFTDPIKKRIALVSGWSQATALMLVGCAGGLRVVFRQIGGPPAIQQPVWWLLITLALVLIGYAVFQRIKLKR